MLLIENVIDAILTQLQAGMDAKMDALNLSYADGINLRKPRSDSYYKGDKAVIRNYPAVLVMPLNTDNYDTKNYLYEHYVDIEFTDKSPRGDETTLQTIMMRGTRAIMELLRADLSFGGSVIYSEVLGITYTEVMDSGRALLQSVIINVVCRTCEEI